jgi:hypothetical protein
MYFTCRFHNLWRSGSFTACGFRDGVENVESVERYAALLFLLLGGLSATCVGLLAMEKIYDRIVIIGASSCDALTRVLEKVRHPTSKYDVRLCTDQRLWRKLVGCLA